MSGTSSLGWRVADRVSALLDPGERAAVCGDLMELGVDGRRALGDVLGLVLRRQLALWRDWHPWLAVAAVALPIGVLLSYASRWWFGIGGRYFVWYVKGWSSAFLASPGARRDLLELAVGALLCCATLVVWSWTSGYVLGRLSRRAVWITGTLFCAAVLLGTFGTPTTAREPSLLYYRVVWPRTLQAAFVLLPALAGMKRGVRLAPLQLRSTVAGVITVALLTLWAAQRLENSLLFGRGRVPPSGPDRIIGTADDGRPLWPVSLLMLWPSALSARRGALAPALRRGGRSDASPERHLTPALLTATALGAACATVMAQQTALDYPQWRGRERDGAASAFVEPRAWPQALTKRWRIDVGEGYSTPIVVGDTVYVFARQGENEVMTALDCRLLAPHSGARVIPASYSPSQAAAAHGAGPKATPLFHDGKLFTLGISGIVSAFDAASGKLLWQTPRPAEAPFYGAASSPLGEGNLVIVHPGDYGPLTAFDAATGAAHVDGR